MSLITIQIGDEVAALARRYAAAAPVVRSLIARALDAENLDTVSYILETKLTAAGPRFLNVQSGRLRRSIVATRATVARDTIASAIGSNVRYAAVHEFGYKGEQRVKSFVRRNYRHANLRTGGRLKRPVQTGTSTVRAFVRRVNYRARAPIKTGVTERVDGGHYTRRIISLLHTEFSQP